MATAAALTVKILGDAANLRTSTAIAVERLNELESVAKKSASAPIATFAKESESIASVGTAASVAAQKTAQNVEKIATVGTRIRAAKEGFFELKSSIDSVSGSVANLSGGAERVAQNLENAARGAISLGTQFGAISRGTGAALNATINGAKILGTTALTLVALASYKAFTSGIAFQAAFASVVVRKLELIVSSLYAKLSLFAGVPLLLALVATLENSRRAIADLTGSTTPLQKSVEAICSAWNRWAEALGGSTLDFVAEALNAAASAMNGVRDAMDAVESIPFLGAALSSVESLIGPLTILVGVLAALRSISLFFFAGKMVATLAAYARGVYSITTAVVAWAASQTGLNVALTYTAAITGVGIALIAVAAAAAAGYSASVAGAAETTESFASATSSLGDKAEIAKDQYAALKKSIEDSNSAARSPLKKYEEEIAIIEEKTTAQERASKTIAELQKKETNLVALLNDANSRLSRDQKKDAQVRIETIKKERDELQKTFDATLKYSDAAKKHDQESARQNALKNLNVDSLFTDSPAAKFNEQKSNLEKAFSAKLIDARQFKTALAKATEEFEKADPATVARRNAESEYAKTVEIARKKAFDATDWNRQKAGEIFAGFDGINLSSFSSSDQKKIVATFNDEFLRATKNGSFLADAFAASSTIADRFSLAFSDLENAAKYLEISTTSATERDVALADAKKRLTENLLSQTSAGKYLLDAQKNAATKTERLEKIYEELENTAKAAKIGSDVLDSAKEAAKKDIFGADPDVKNQKKEGQNEAAFRGSTAALDAINSRSDATIPYFKKIVENGRKTTEKLDEIAKKTKNAETYKG